MRLIHAMNVAVVDNLCQGHTHAHRSLEIHVACKILGKFWALGLRALGLTHEHGPRTESRLRENGLGTRVVIATVTGYIGPGRAHRATLQN